MQKANQIRKRANYISATTIMLILAVLFMTFFAVQQANSFATKETQSTEQSIEFYRKQAESAFQERMEFAERMDELDDIIYILEKKMMDDFGIEYEDIKKIKAKRAIEKNYKHYR